MDRPFISRQISIDPLAHPDRGSPRDPDDPVVRWQAHVDAGRIGNRIPLDPAILDNLLRTDALFRSFARGAGRRA